MPISGTRVNTVSDRARAVSAEVREGTSWWPNTDSSFDPSGVVVVTVNYNTKRLVSILLWSLYRFLGSELRSVVVVDNGSSDGSSDILRACARAGLCELIPNGTNRCHGPAISQALSHCASRSTGADGDRPWFWLLDSDCVMARPDAATEAMSVARGAGAAREVSNILFDWAAGHHEPHFQQVSEARARYSALLEEFDEAVRDLWPEQLVSACRRK